MEMIKFQVTLKKDANPEEVKQSLEALAKDLKLDTFDVGSLKNDYLFGITSVETYKQVFGATVIKDTKKIGNLEFNVYYELRHARVPQTLKDKIEYIRLDERLYPNAKL